MKFAHIADAHLGYRQYKSDKRALDFAQAFKKAIEFAEMENVDFILIAGDLFHKKSEMDPVTLAQATVVLEKCKKPVLVVEGNHDSTYFRERFSWIDYLQARNLVINLKPSFEGGEIVIEEWDGESGAYVDLGEARVYGLKYYGMLTERILGSYLPMIKRDGFTVFMSHFGLEGYMNIYGCINSQILYRYDSKIDYVALGHIHKKYIENEYIFNPGSLETCDILEYSFEKGFFLIERDGEMRWRHVTSFYTPRVFRVIELNFVDYEDLRQRLLHEKGSKGEVVLLRIKADKNLDREKIERIASEILEPLVLRVEVDYSRGTLQALTTSYSSKTEIEREVISAILKGFGYEGIDEVVLTLKELFTAGEINEVEEIVTQLLSERLKEAEEVEEEEEWRWWETE